MEAVGGHIGARPPLSVSATAWRRVAEGGRPAPSFTAVPEEGVLMGRPTKLTDEVQEQILQAIRAGVSIYAAAEFAHIDRSTFHRWMVRGRPEGTKRADARFRTFRARVEQARAQAEVRDVSIIAQAAPHD